MIRGILSIVRVGKPGAPFLVEDETYNYVTGRFPPDAWGVGEEDGGDGIKEGMPH